MNFEGKNIVLLSQQDWGEMFISKHHYAVELARAGAIVYYINGPEQKGEMKRGEINIAPSGYDNVYLVTHRLSFPLFLKFKAQWLYNYLLRSHIRKLLQAINRKVDVVWSFDVSNTIPLSLFSPTARKIYMPVDELSKQVANKAAKSAELIVSVTQEILDKFDVPVPKLFLNHGVAPYFINEHPEEKTNTPLQVGLSGNFLRPDIDRDTLYEIVTSNPEIVFNFWGMIDFSISNLLSSGSEEQIQFIEKLKQCTNVKLHGQVSPIHLAGFLKNMDAFLICYDVVKDQSKGTNYHKILEYLGTGKVIVSNNVSTYKNHPALLQMVAERDNNRAMPTLFKQVVNNITAYNTIEKQEQRISFAKSYIYSNQVKKIAQHLS